MGKPEFIGRAIGKPHIQLCEDPYVVPKLEWFQIYRGTEEAGELLSAFEMFEVSIEYRLLMKSIIKTLNIIQIYILPFNHFNLQNHPNS